jgi:hypothetical protein
MRLEEEDEERMARQEQQREHTDRLITAVGVVVQVVRIV